MSARKPLIDACVSPAVTHRLRADGHDVLSVLDLPADPGDRAILEWAAAEARAIVTIDSDFGTLVFRDGVASVGVLRLREARPAVQALRASDLVDRHGADLEAGAFVTDDGGGVRVSKRLGSGS
jgi:predicted nuclease of predicted toxin-antitoxin system